MAEIQKDLTISLLLDFYGQMLTDKQREVIKFYYNQDLSLAEIAQHSGITRQGVRDSIKRAERQLLDFEEKLGLYKKFHQIQEGLEQIMEHADLIQEENNRLFNSEILAEQVEEIKKTVRNLNY